MDILLALSPLDGRYSDLLEPLRTIFSEYGLIKNRVKIELYWLRSLSESVSIFEVPPFSSTTLSEIEQVVDNFSLADAHQIKAIESQTNHDVKAVEYWLKQRFADHTDIQVACEFIHFACTSEDINNLSYALMVQQALDQVLLPCLDQVFEQWQNLAHQWAEVAMMSRTHGQPATPTTVGKEFANVAYRLKRQLIQLKQQVILGKVNGAVGNYNAHLIAYPNIDWLAHTQNFVESLGLGFNPYTTQIEPHDYLAEIFHILCRINQIMIDFNRDIWGYISLGYFKQQLKNHEIGSSTMPHKVNPIDFENSEGNAGLANAMLYFLGEKLPISRWQRDLTDSTVLRNIGVGMGYAVLAYRSHLRGLAKLQINVSKLDSDLEMCWELLAEPIQTVMRRYGLANPYEQLKALTRGVHGMNQANIIEFIDSLDLPEQVKQELKALTPKNYTGLAKTLAQQI